MNDAGEFLAKVGKFFATGEVPKISLSLRMKFYVQTWKRNLGSVALGFFFFKFTYVRYVWKF